VTWELSLTGLLIGILVGLTGMGGGSLMTPVLVLLFGYNPTVAIGTDIAHGAIFKTVGAVRHRRLGNVQARLSGWMFLGSAPMSLLGVWVATRLSDQGTDAKSASAASIPERALRGALAATLAVAGLKLIDPPGSSYMVVAFLGGGLVVLTLWLVRKRLGRIRVYEEEGAR
jgi:hypothetical protein